ncbi:prohibitin family protein [Clostridium botulinum D/C]|uniref:prohibitin family protein n=1 Tax=Clostridium botulinum TaxID=1491 RepID=UPI001E46783B|nr:prohibitin family protein [Clostridium botulinum]MCD3321125.1 prohibitin family protein [Clostridium botulinum D/C]MCD3324565.1 prohibitin family protein [Clostridium botulinum D/C]MCD3326869.1 prohibitin family protein [Clostridium botulinum D/C]
MNKNKIGAIIVGMAIIGGLFGVIKCTSRIKAGYVGVVYNMNGGVQQEILSQGWHVVAPWKHVTQYSIATEQAYLSKDKKEGSEDDDSFMIPTSDGKTVNTDIEFSYHFNPDKVNTTFVRFKGQKGEEIEKKFMKGKIKAWASEVSSKFSVLDIYGAKRADLNKAVYDYAKKRFDEYGIVIDSVNFSRIGLDSATANAIQTRINAQQSLEKSKIDRQQAEILAEKKRIEAKGNADALLIKAQGESKANKELQQSLTQELIELKKYEKWDGKLPQVQGGNGTIVDIKAK